tara:strand:+ start:175 stop:519 length:345 start_codon:yes stop_codon:yes gene_type:complete
MSFFVSKSLVGKVDENCLIPSEESDTLSKEFVLETSNFVCHIQEVTFSPDNTVSVRCECNIHVIDSILDTKDNQGKIKFKNSSMIVTDLKIENIFKEDGDNYIVGLKATYSMKG